MNEEIFEKYKNEMLRMYRQSQQNNTPSTNIPPAPNTNTSDLPNNSSVAPPPSTQENTQNGRLLGVVTSFNALYPVQNARVTVFTGEYENMNVIDRDTTDQSGKTKVFLLPTPDKNLSMSPDLSEKPYAVYNMVVESDGFLTNIHLNIPVFSGITSIQRSDLILDQDQTGNEPQIFDEGQKYNL